MHRRPLPLFCIALAIGVQSPAQQPPIPKAVPPATFRSTTKLVQVDVTVRHGDAPVAGLTQKDFALFDNGTPQEIAFFAVRSRTVASRSAAAPLRTALPPGTVSNHLDREGEALANATVLLIDQRNTPQEVQTFAIQRVVKFLEHRRDQTPIAIYRFTRGGSIEVIREVTSDAGLLGRAASRLKGQDPKYRNTDTTGMTKRAADGLIAMTLIERGSDSTHALQAVARHLADVPGRKNLVWITTGFALFNVDAGIDFRPDMEKIARVLNDANVALYAVDARGLQGTLSGISSISDAQNPITLRQIVIQTQRGEGDSPELATMNMLASMTGGRVFYNRSNGIEDSIQTAVDDSEVTYTLGFYPSQDGQNGAWHKLKVSLDRPAVSVRYRMGYFASGEGDAARERPTLEQLLKDPLDATQLELLAGAGPDPEKPGFLRVSVNIDLHGLQLAHENGVWSGAIDISFYCEGTGKALTKTSTIAIPDDRYVHFLEKGIDATASIEAKTGIEAFRVVVQDRTTGSAGSVTVPLPKQ